MQTMAEKQDPNVIATTIRLPKALLEQVGEIAAADRRSRNAMIIVLLEEAAERRLTK